MEPTSPELLSLQTVSHSYRTYPAVEPVLQDVSFSLNEGASLALLGPSGCGKSTLLMLAAGLLSPLTGSCVFSGQELSRPHPAIALMQQQYGLFPWKTVRQNIELSLLLRQSRVEDAQLQQLIGELGISGKLQDYPGQLSGGQQQRVALARSLLLHPRLMLLDEPFGALDSITRERLQDLLRSVWQREGFAMLTVTHSMQEAVMLGERILVMGGQPGRILHEIDNSGMRAPAFRDSRESAVVLEQLRRALGEAA